MLLPQLGTTTWSPNLQQPSNIHTIPCLLPHQQQAPIPFPFDPLYGNLIFSLTLFLVVLPHLSLQCSLLNSQSEYGENTDLKKLRIWALFTQCVVFFQS